MSKLINEPLAKGIFVVALTLIGYSVMKLYRPNYQTLYFMANKKTI